MKSDVLEARGRSDEGMMEEKSDRIWLVNADDDLSPSHFVLVTYLLVTAQPTEAQVFCYGPRVQVQLL